MQEQSVMIEASKKSHDVVYFIKALRVHQWVKNLLVFTPMVVGHAFDKSHLVHSTMAFIFFCMVASSVYLINDLLDIKHDQNHPVKKHRPFASGKLPVYYGWYGAFFLLGSAFALSYHMLPKIYLYVMFIYFASSSFYSIYFKEKLVLDIIILASLYTLRILAGNAAILMMPSMWLLAFSMFFFLSLASIKRQAELLNLIKQDKKTVLGRAYQIHDLSNIQNLAQTSGLISILVFALYLNSDHVVTLYQHPQWLWVLCLILLYWLIRIGFITSRGHMNEDPILFAVKDRVTLGLTLLGVMILMISALPISI